MNTTTLEEFSANCKSWGLKVTVHRIEHMSDDRVGSIRHEFKIIASATETKKDAFVEAMKGI